MFKVLMALIIAMVLRASSEDPLLPVSVSVPYSRLLELRAEESYDILQVKPSGCGEASRKPWAHRWDRVQAIGALAHCFNHWATRAPAFYGRNSGIEKYENRTQCFIGSSLAYLFKFLFMKNGYWQRVRIRSWHPSSHATVFSLYDARLVSAREQWRTLRRWASCIYKVRKNTIGLFIHIK